MPTVPITYTIRIQGMHCASCGLLIDDALADLPDVRASRTSFRTGLSTVQLSDGTATPADILTAITQLGYAATITNSASPPGGD